MTTTIIDESIHRRWSWDTGFNQLNPKGCETHMSYNEEVCIADYDTAVDIAEYIADHHNIEYDGFMVVDVVNCTPSVILDGEEYSIPKYMVEDLQSEMIGCNPQEFLL